MNESFFDRSVFRAVNLCDGDQLTFTYTLTFSGDDPVQFKEPDPKAQVQLIKDLRFHQLEAFLDCQPPQPELGPFPDPGFVPEILQYERWLASVTHRAT